MENKQGLNNDLQDLPDELDSKNNTTKSRQSLNQKNQSSDNLKPFYNSTIPNDWEVNELSKVGIFSKGKGILKEQVIASGLPCIRYGEIYTSHNFIIKEFKSFISEDVAKESQEIKNGDILFAGSGETIEEIGKSVAYIGNEKAYAGGDVIILSTNGNVKAECLSYALETDFVRKQKRRYGQGQQVVHIYPSDLAKVKVALPPLPEQKAIAHVLGLMDEVINRNNQIIAQKELRKKWLMQNLLTGRRRLKDFDRNWNEYSLVDVAKFLNGKAYRQEELLEKGKYKVLRVGNFFTNSNWYFSDLELEDDKYVNKGDLMYAWSASFGPRFWKGEKTIYHYHIWKVIPTKMIVKNFLYYFLVFDTERIFNNKQGGTMFHVTKGDMEKRKIIVPSIEEQTAIALLLQAVDKEIQLLKTKTEKLKEQKKGMMQVLLTGKKRLTIK